MKIRFILILITQTLALNTFAQDNYCNCNTDFRQNTDFEAKLFGKAFINKYPGKNIQFFKSWMPGDLLMSDGSIVKNKILGYNSMLDELIWMRTPDYQQVVLNKKTIAGFTLYGTNNIKIAEFRKLYLKNWLSGDSSSTYLQVLVKGRLTLYVERKVILISNTEIFQNEDQYYLQKEDKLYDMKPNRRSLFRLMGNENDKNRMKAIVRKNFLFVNKEPQLVKAI